MKYQVCVIGRFGFGRTMLNGQTIKTKILTEALTDALGTDAMTLVDTYGGVRALLRLPFQCFRALRQSRNVIILPAHKGIRVIAPILCLYNAFFRRKLHYVVIGGWLNEMLKNKKLLSWCLKRFDWIYAETTTMQRRLEERGFRNVVLMPNCKELPILDPSELRTSADGPCRLCTFSRVMEEKGIGDAVEAVREVNARLGRTAYTLDIYGQVDQKQTDWFEALRRSFPDFIRYGGEVPFDQSVSVLKDYDALLFPTRFYTEGIPGTIIDAYAAGLPVIASIWENHSDIIDGQTGVTYPFGDPGGLNAALLDLAGETGRLHRMRPACLRRAHDFTTESVFQTLISRLEP